MKKRIILMTSILALCVASVSGCGSSSKAVSIPKMEECFAINDTNVSDTTFKFDKTLDNLDGKYALVAENEKYELYLDEDKISFCVKQKSTNEIFNSALIPDEHGVTVEDINPKTLDRYRSPFQLTYYDKSKDNASTISAYLEDFKLDSSGIKTYEIKKNNDVVGFRAEYPIKSYGNSKDVNITLKIDYTITDNGFDVSLPSGCITEEGHYAVTKVTLLPFFESASNDEDGYYLYPDGSGAIMEFKDSSHNGEQPVTYNVYGDLQNYTAMLGEWDEEEAEVFIPVYGANVNNKSYTAIIKAGEETSSITITPGTAKDPFNHLNATFEFRKAFNDQRYAAAGSDKTVLTFDNDLLDIPRSISFNLFEAGEDTNYSDMAVCYREYLQNDLGVKKDESEADNIPVSIDFFMGIKEDGLIVDEFQTTTSFKQVETIIEDLLNNNQVETIEAQLKGWTKNGYYTDPDQFPVNSHVGGKSGLKDLTNKYKDNNNVKITLETNLLEAKESADNYNMNTDTITLGNYMVFGATKADGDIYLLSPNVSSAIFNDMLKNASKYKSENINGYSFKGVGKYLLYNYNSNNTLNLTQGKKIWEDMLKKNEDMYKTTVVEGANQYVLSSADKLTNIPYEDSGYRLTTEGVPFLQIALHGLIEFTGEPGNLSSDIEREKLKWIEYGYTPYFELTYESSDKLMYTDYNELFSSEYKTWQEEVRDTYRMFNDGLEDVWDACIISHEKVADDVVKVTYDNKKAVYVNYTDKEYKTDKGTIVESMSFAVVDE